MAQESAVMYPTSLLEMDREGSFISNYPRALISKMVNRNNTLNRAPKKRTSEFDPKIPIKERKTSNILQETCVNWNSEQSKSADSKSVMELKQNYLKELYFKNQNSKNQNSCIDRETIKNNMKICFPLQRTYLNNRQVIPRIENIKDNWPYLFQKEFLHQHFEQLMSIDPKVLKIEFAKQKNILFDFFKLSKNKNLRGIEADDINIVTGLTHYFKENSSFLFMEFEVWFLHTHI